MRFVNKWSYACAHQLAGAMNENHQKRSVYYFGLQIVIGSLVKGVILISVALLLGVLIPTLLIAFTFATLRMAAGGYHMDTYGKCLFVSLGLFITAALIAQYTYSYWNFMWLAVLLVPAFILGFYVIIRYAPKDTPNKPITDPRDIRKFKKLSIIYLSVCLAVIAVLTVLGLNMYVLSLCFGVLLELFTVTPAGHKFFDMIKHGMNFKPAANKKALH